MTNPLGGAGRGNSEEEKEAGLVVGMEEKQPRQRIQCVKRSGLSSVRVRGEGR